MQLGNRLVVLFVLSVGSIWLSGCGTLGSATATPTASRALPTATSTSAPTFTPTAAPTPTDTRTPTTTPRPTLTPTPTPQPMPTPTPPLGWKKLETAQFELWVPPSFVGGDLIKDKDMLIKNLRALGPEYAGYIKPIEQTPSPFALYAIDSKIGSTGFITTITVTINQIVSTGQGDVYQGGVSQQLPQQYAVIDRRMVALNYYSAERMVADTILPTFRMRQLVYTVRSPNTAWIMAFSTAEGEFLARLPVFEQSALTWRIKP